MQPSRLRCGAPPDDAYSSVSGWSAIPAHSGNSWLSGCSGSCRNSTSTKVAQRRCAGLSRAAKVPTTPPRSHSGPDLRYMSQCSSVRIRATKCESRRCGAGRPSGAAIGTTAGRWRCKLTGLGIITALLKRLQLRGCANSWWWMPPLTSRMQPSLPGKRSTSTVDAHRTLVALMYRNCLASRRHAAAWVRLPRGSARRQRRSAHLGEARTNGPGTLQLQHS